MGVELLIVQLDFPRAYIPVHGAVSPVVSQGV